MAVTENTSRIAAMTRRLRSVPLSSSLSHPGTKLVSCATRYPGGSVRFARRVALNLAAILSGPMNE